MNCVGAWHGGNPNEFQAFTDNWGWFRLGVDTCDVGKKFTRVDMSGIVEIKGPRASNIPSANCASQDILFNWSSACFSVPPSIYIILFYFFINAHERLSQRSPDSVFTARAFPRFQSHSNTPMPACMFSTLKNRCFSPFVVEALPRLERCALHRRQCTGCSTSEASSHRTRRCRARGE